jgi:hypothetical protein
MNANIPASSPELLQMLQKMLTLQLLKQSKEPKEKN